MNVIQRPRSREFCATMQDYVIDTDSTISFAVEYGGKRILEEEYVPDAQNQVRVRRLGHFCELALWGVWCAGEVHWQLSVAGTFSFFINNVKDMDCHVTYSILQTRKSADAPGVLSEATQKVTRPGVPEYASGFLAGSGYALSGTGADGVEKSVEVAVPSQGDAPFTVDASYSRVCQQLGVSSLRSYRVGFSGGSLEFLVDASRYADLRVQQRERHGHDVGRGAEIRAEGDGRVHRPLRPHLPQAGVQVVAQPAERPRGGNPLWRGVAAHRRHEAEAGARLPAQRAGAGGVFVPPGRPDTEQPD